MPAALRRQHILLFPSYAADYFDMLMPPFSRRLRHIAIFMRDAADDDAAITPRRLFRADFFFSSPSEQFTLSTLCRCH